MRAHTYKLHTYTRITFQCWRYSPQSCTCYTSAFPPLYPQLTSNMLLELPWEKFGDTAWMTANTQLDFGGVCNCCGGGCAVIGAEFPGNTTTLD